MGLGYRIATLDDLPALTDVMTTAFIADPAWGPYSFPDDARREPQSSAFWEQGLRRVAVLLDAGHARVRGGCGLDPARGAGDDA